MLDLDQPAADEGRLAPSAAGATAPAFLLDAPLPWHVDAGGHRRRARTPIRDANGDPVLLASDPDIARAVVAIVNRAVRLEAGAPSRPRLEGDASLTLPPSPRDARQ